MSTIVSLVVASAVAGATGCLYEDSGPFVTDVRAVGDGKIAVDKCYVRHSRREMELHHCTRTVMVVDAKR